MANIVEMTYTFEIDTAKNHFSKSGGMNLGSAGLGMRHPLILYMSNTGDATFNSTGKSFLYPKDNIHPFKMAWKAIITTNCSDSNLKIFIDNSQIFDVYCPEATGSNPDIFSYDNITLPAVLNSTKNSTIVIRMSTSENGLFKGYSLHEESYIKLYFQQWDLTAQKVGDGWGTILAPGRVYDNENVNYTCIVGNGCTFHGWYSDAAHTNLVSSDTTYTITASQDLVLYAYITRDVLALNNVYTKTNFHLGENAPGWFKPYKIWYKTLNGWEAQSNTNNLIAGNTYRYSDNFIQTFDLANIDSSLVNPSDSSLYSKNFTVFYYPWEHGTIYVKNSNNYIIRNITIYSESYFIQPMQDNSFIIHYNGEYRSLIQSIYITYQETISDEIKTFIFNIQFTTFERDIQFKDLNGNLYKEKLICTSPFTVTTPSGSEYNGFTGWKEIYCGTPTGRILQLNESYWDVGWNNEIYYEPVFNE